MRQAIELLRHERASPRVLRGADAILARHGRRGRGADDRRPTSASGPPGGSASCCSPTFVPAMLLGPLFGAAADRWSRKGCSVVADVLRAVAFAGIAIFGSFEATVAFAVLAGIGTGLFTPASLASLPSLVEERRLPAATSLYGAIADLGFTAGPALAAVFLVLGGPETILTLNAVSFAVSALALGVLSFGAAPPAAGRGAGRAGDRCSPRPARGSGPPRVWPACAWSSSRRRRRSSSAASSTWRSCRSRPTSSTPATRASRCSRPSTARGSSRAPSRGRAGEHPTS